MTRDARYRWRPSYQTGGKKNRRYTVQIESVECPASFITAESRYLIDLEAECRRMKGATGAALFGLDSGRWPAVWADAVVVIESCGVQEHNAMIRALDSD